MSNTAGKKRFQWLRGKELKRGAEELGSAASKQNLWTQVGMGLGGLLAMSVTGGAASPLIAAAMMGGGTYLGGKIGQSLSRKKGGKVEGAGGRFFTNESKSIAENITTSILTGSLTNALTTGLAKFAMPATTPTGTYKDTLWGKIGKSLDFKDSALGKSYGNIMHEGGWAGKALRDEAAASLTGGTEIPQERMDWLQGEVNRLNVDKTIAAAEQRAIENYKVANTPIGSTMEIRRPTFEPTFTPSQIESQGLISPSLESAGLTPGELNRYDVINRMEEAGYNVSPGGILPEEYGRGYIDKAGSIVRPPGTPDVPMNIDYIDEFLTEGEQLAQNAKETLQPGFRDPGSMKMNKALQELHEYQRANTIQDPGFSEFGQWEQAPSLPTGETIRSVPYDYQSVASKRQRDLLDSLRWQNRLFGE
jgi:hypothetical protein